MKNYVCFVNDHSGSMSHLATAAAKDFNANIEAVKNAASAEMLDTVVSVAECSGTTKNPLTVTISNPHVLRPVNRWAANSSTPLWGTTQAMLRMLATLPDINKPEVSVLVMMTTDGEATDNYNLNALQTMMRPLLDTGRYTFVARVPSTIRPFALEQLSMLGIAAGNIQTWDTTAEGMEASTRVTTQAMAGYFRARSAGKANSSSFFSDASKVDITALTDVSKEISLYVVPDADNGIEIRPFVLKHRMKHLKGSAFYQLTKTEPKVQHDKAILVRDRASGKFFSGADARKMIGLPVGQNARLHPGDHKNFDIFIQSNSINRKLVGGTGLAYWEKAGTEFKPEDLAYLGEKSPFYVAPKTPAAPANTVVQLPQVNNTSGRPTPNPIPVVPMFDYFETRDDARDHCAAFGIVQSKIQRNPAAPKSRRWAVPTALKKIAPAKKAA